MAISFSVLSTTARADNFVYNDERFADLQMLRYQVHGFDQLSLRQKTLVYYLSEAALCGRDILWDQNGRYNLRIRQLLETIYTDYQGDRKSEDFQAFTTYLKRVWFSNGIHHHYGCEKFQPEFSEDFLRQAIKGIDPKKLPFDTEELFPVIFDPTVMPKRTNQADGEDLVFVTVSVVDGKHTPVPNCNNELTFSVEGAGVFEAVCNGDATSLQSFKQPTMKLFNGELVVIIRPTQEAGTIHLHIKDSNHRLRDTTISIPTH